ncbi:MAG: DUF3253 domain-containing protein [Rhodothalassiaceae bacterium]
MTDYAEQKQVDDPGPEKMPPRQQQAQLRAAILQLVADRGAGKSICPSEAAKAVATDWRPLMKPVRRIAIDLMREGRITILRKGKPVASAEEVRGVIRLTTAADGPLEQSKA